MRKAAREEIDEAEDGEKFMLEAEAAEEEEKKKKKKGKGKGKGRGKGKGKGKAKGKNRGKKEETEENPEVEAVEEAPAEELSNAQKKNKRWRLRDRSEPILQKVALFLKDPKLRGVKEMGGPMQVQVLKCILLLPSRKGKARRNVILRERIWAMLLIEFLMMVKVIPQKKIKWTLGWCGFRWSRTHDMASVYRFRLGVPVWGKRFWWSRGVLEEWSCGVAVAATYPWAEVWGWGVIT